MVLRPAPGSRRPGGAGRSGHRTDRLVQAEHEPALILGYAVCYGVAIGIISHIADDYIAKGIVLQAVVGTMVAFGGTLAVYALKIFRPTPKFTKFVIAAGFAAVGLMLLNWIASIFVGGGLGLRTDSPLAGSSASR